MVVVNSDLQEEILLRLPLKSIIKFKSVSQQWRSTIESRSFARKRRIIMSNVQSKPQFLAAPGESHRPTVFPEKGAGEKEDVEMFYLESGFAARPALSCDGFVCIPVPGWICVLNPSTGEFLRFSSGRDPPITNPSRELPDGEFEVFPGYWRMGFGRDKVNGSYKIVRLFFEPNYFGHILDLDIGTWRNLKSPPPYYIGKLLKSAYVNGSIYWLEIDPFQEKQKILALDLHTEEFRDVPTPPSFCMSGQIANLEDRLVLAAIDARDPRVVLIIWALDSQEESWSITYSFCVNKGYRYIDLWWPGYMPLSVSKQGHLFFLDQFKNLRKYYPETNIVRRLTTSLDKDRIHVISPYVENLLPLRQRPSKEIKTFGFWKQERSSPVSSSFKSIELPSSDALFSVSVVALSAIVLYRYFRSTTC